MNTHLCAALARALPFVVAGAVAAGSEVRAGVAESWDTAKAAKLGHWRAALRLAESTPERVAAGLRSSTAGEIYEFTAGERITSLSLVGRIDLRTDRSLARVVLVDAEGREHLVYEAYPLLVDRKSLNVRDACEETCLLDSVVPRSLRLDLVDASVSIDEVRLGRAAGGPGEDALALRHTIRKAQHDAKLARLKEQIGARQLGWDAGQTTVSPWTFEEKRRLFLGGVVPNLQGAEYYRGGVFEVGSGSRATVSAVTQGAGLVEAFDWRSRHGANDPDSPYFDDDPLGSGWMTSVKNQDGCGSCWAFAATGATEALVNLYFNDHLDLDLSEQDALSCGGAGTCAGGWPGMTLNYYSQAGVVDEACFPYVAMDVPCDRCANPEQLIRIDGQVPFPQSWPPRSSDLKQMILDYGPLSGGIYSWRHAMPLVGWRSDPADGSPIWIFKNSWGDWGENGYGYLKVDMYDIGWTHALRHPVTSAVPYAIRCRDEDGDGFYNWGVSWSRPASCPQEASPERDCDDSDAEAGPFDGGGSCALVAHVDVRPGSCPNPLNRTSKGVLPVAIVGTKRLPVSRIDVSSITLEGVAPTRHETADVATPYDPPTGRTRAKDCSDSGGDGVVDLMLKFETEKISRALAGATRGDVVPLRLRARLKARYGARALFGEDVVVIVK
jgi:hypothetical protein